MIVRFVRIGAHLGQISSYFLFDRSLTFAKFYRFKVENFSLGYHSVELEPRKKVLPLDQFG